MSPATTEALQWAAKHARAEAARARAMADMPGVVGDVEGYAHKLEGFAVEFHNLQGLTVAIDGETYEVREFLGDREVLIKRTEGRGE